MVALLLILRDCGVAAKNTLFKHFLRLDRPQLSSACTEKSTEQCAERNVQFEEESTEESTRATLQLSRASCASRLQIAQSKLPIKIPTLRRKFAKLRGKEHPV